ncbi:hypothetical protein EDB80DRAFT_740912 [Ilyonectria destructans]|nr:hypothetical protein EDB80DRAFT_740912 [Ilyonectria destructans]
MSNRPGSSIFPGFTALSDRVFARGSEQFVDAKPIAEHPRAVVIYGWGDAPPKHVSKFTDGYRQLYPNAKQIAVLSPIYKGFFDNVSQRSDQMLPIIHEIFPKDSSDGFVLFHVLSNSGAINYSATLNAYKELYNRPMPHALTVYDSTPGTPELTWDNLKRWSNAMAIGAAPRLPLPFIVTQTFCGLFFCWIHLFDYLSGGESAPMFSKRIFYDEGWESNQSLRLFLYGKEDIIIPWEHIEQHIADGRESGYPVDGQLFDDSGHVGHMRKHPERYWETIGTTWKKAAESSYTVSMEYHAVRPIL